jgi:hypothetical protein
MRPQQLEAFSNAWHGNMTILSPAMEVFPSGEQIGLSLNK